MKPIYDEGLYCSECDAEISIQEDFFNGHLCDECAFSLDEKQTKGNEND